MTFSQRLDGLWVWVQVYWAIWTTRKEPFDQKQSMKEWEENEKENELLDMSKKMERNR